MTEKTHETKWLEAHFDAARRQPAPPLGDLMQRVIADAERVQAERGTAPATKPARMGWMRQLYHVLGGLPAVTGLGTAAAVGLWLGVFPPAALDRVAQGYLGAEDQSYVVDVSVDGAFGLGEGAM